MKVHGTNWDSNPTFLASVILTKLLKQKLLSARSLEVGCPHYRHSLAFGNLRVEVAGVQNLEKTAGAITVGLKVWGLVRFRVNTINRVIIPLGLRVLSLVRLRVKAIDTDLK